MGVGGGSARTWLTRHTYQQLISLWQRTKDRDNDPLLWGDEVSVSRAR